jgi:Flp pilus assembly protein TadG
MRANSTKRQKQKGSAIVEGAFVILPLIVLFVGMIDFSYAIFIQNTLREAVREGVRFAITQQTGVSGQDAAIKRKVKEKSLNLLTDAELGAGRARFTITYYDGATLAEVSGAGSNAGGNICVVTAAVQHSWMAPLWRAVGMMDLSASSSDVMEAPAAGVLPGR